MKNIEKKQGVLYVVATPIGNLEDISFRAVMTLRESDLVACEDTRVTKKLLNHYSIQTRTISYHQHSKISKIENIISEIEVGKDVALVTDAGTPGISDPGNKLVEKALTCGIKVVPIPGPSAVTALASVSGIDMQKFLFLGFVPHKKGRETFFNEVAGSKYPVMYYDSVHRVVKNLEFLKTIDETKDVIVGRELTKMFEEVVRGSVSEVLDYFEKNPSKLKGEFVLIVKNLK